MKCTELLSSKLEDLLSKMGYRVYKNRLEWGIELVVEGRNNITTIGIYNSREKGKVTVEISGLTNSVDFTVDIIDCRCINGGIFDCIDKILATIQAGR